MSYFLYLQSLQLFIYFLQSISLLLIVLATVTVAQLPVTWRHYCVAQSLAGPLLGVALYI